MALPAVAARAVATRFSSWLGTSNIGVIRSVKTYLAAHPTAASIVASTGITGLVDAAMSGDTDAISALNDAAAQHGVTLDGGSVVSGGNGGSTGGSILDGIYETVSENVGSLFKDDDVIKKDERSADATLQERELVRFLKGEVSASPAYIIRYHALMSEFIRMDHASVVNLVRAYS